MTDGRSTVAKNEILFSTAIITNAKWIAFLVNRKLIVNRPFAEASGDTAPNSRAQAPHSWRILI
jgi:hypothetical protein